jgi:hypothetical protein
MVLYAYVCVCAFSLCRESPDRVLGDKPLLLGGGCSFIYASSVSLYDTPYISWDTSIVSKMGPMIAMGSAKAQGSKVKPTESGKSHPEQPEGGMKRPKGWPAFGAFGTPLRGPDILKLCI